MTKDDLKKVLDDHALWLRGEGGARADLRGANLRWADLRWADLRWAYLEGADLQGADLQGANLQDADLREANLWSTVGNGREVKSLQCGVYDIAFTHDTMQIGCKRYPIKDWFEFDYETISSMDDGALEWWRKWKPVLKQIVEVA